MRALLDDARLALRSLARAPAYAVSVIATLAVALGGVTAVFSLLYDVVLEPLPFPRASELVMLDGYFATVGIDHLTVSPRELLDVKERNEVFAEVGALATGSANFVRSGRARSVPAAYVTPGLLRVLETPPAYGRFFDDAEGEEGAPQVCILGSAFHRQAFGGDPTVVGQIIDLAGYSMRIVGVLPEVYDRAVRDVENGQAFSVWLPITFSAEQRDPANRGGRFLRLFARLKPGLTLEAAQAEAARFTRMFGAEHPDKYGVGRYRMTARPLRSYFGESSTPTVFLLLAAVALVLLVACANVASLTLARLSSRRRELAARVALGASARRLSSHVLTEAALLALGGSLLGVVVGLLAVDALTSLFPNAIPLARREGLSWPVALMLLGATAVTGLVTGIAPAVHAARTPPGEVLRESSRASAGRRTFALRSALVAAQVALALALLSGTWTLLRSLAHLTAASPGFDARGLAAGRVSLSDVPYEKPAEQRRYVHAMHEHLRAAPGVEAAGYTSGMPLRQWSDFSFTVEAQPEPPPGQTPIAQVRRFGGDYLAAMKTALLDGRAFTASDTEGAPRVALVNRRLAEQHLPHEAVGAVLVMPLLPGRKAERITVVGVVEDVREVGFDHPVQAAIYLPFDQLPSSNVDLVVRAASPALGVSALRTAAEAVDGSQPFTTVGPYEDIVRESLADRRFAATLLGVFAALGLGLSVLGIYGITAYAVAQRTQELGVRLALGADEGSLVRLVLGGTLRMMGVGLAGGAVLAFALGRVLAATVPMLEPWDPIGMFLVGVALLLTGLLSSYLPARRIARLELGHALRTE